MQADMSSQENNKFDFIVQAMMVLHARKCSSITSAAAA